MRTVGIPIALIKTGSGNFDGYDRPMLPAFREPTIASRGIAIHLRLYTADLV